MLIDISGYEGRYAVNDRGQVYSYLTNRFLTPCFDGGNYYYVTLVDKEGRRKSKKIHRIVAETLIPNPENLPCVNHKDCDPSNNSKDNLEWCTYAYNNNYADRIETIQKKIIASETHSQKVSIIMLDKDTEQPIKTFKSVNDAAREVQGSHANIVACLKGRQKTSYGYKWKYAE